MKNNPDEIHPHQHLDDETKKLLMVDLPRKSPNEMTGAELKADISARKMLAERKKQLYEKMRTEVEAKMTGLATSQAAIAKNEAAVVAERKRNASALEDIQKTNAREMLDCQAKSAMELLKSEDEKKRYQEANEEMKHLSKELSKEKDELRKTRQDLDGWRVKMQELKNLDLCMIEQTRKLQARLDEVNAKTNRLRGNMRQALLIEKADPLPDNEQEDPSSVPDKTEETTTPIEMVASSSTPPPPHSICSSPPPSSSSVTQSLGHKSSVSTDSAFDESEATNDDTYYEEDSGSMEESDQEEELEIDEEVDDEKMIAEKETSESPSTTSSDSSDIEILNDDQIPLPPTRSPTTPSPLLGEYEGAELYFSDLEGILGTGKMNDRLMDFLLSTIWKKESREEIRDSTFIFPSLFYTRLIREARQSETERAEETDTQRRERRERAVPENFRGVSGFTKGVDIFEKEYLLVPVVECDHWYLIVIVNPSVLVITAQDTIQAQKKGSEKTTLIILDSLPRTSDWRRDCVDRVLCLYLMFEHKRIHSDRPGRFEKTRMEVILPGSVPSQKNNVDCGFFVVRYAKTFLERPPTDEMLLKKAPKWSDWFPRISAHPTQIRKDAEKRIKDAVDPMIWQKFEQFRADSQLNNEDKVDVNDTDDQNICPISLCRRSLDLLDSCEHGVLWPEQTMQPSSCESPDAKRRRLDSGIASPTPHTPARYSLDATDIRRMKAREVGKWMAAITGDPGMEERCVQVGLRGAIVAKMDEQTLRSSLQLPEEMFAKIWADISIKP